MGSPTPKRTILWSSSPAILGFRKYARLTKHERDLCRGNLVTRRTDRSGKQRYTGKTGKLKQSQYRVCNKKRIASYIYPKPYIPEIFLAQAISLWLRPSLQQALALLPRLSHPMARATNAGRFQSARLPMSFLSCVCVCGCFCVYVHLCVCASTDPRRAVGR